MDTKFKFNEVLDKIGIVKKELPIRLANQAKNYFVSSWDKQAWAGQPWKEVQRRIPGTAAYKYPKGWGLSRRTQPILIGAGRVKGSSGGALRRETSTSVKSATWNLVKLVVDLPYAKRHNEGLDGMPKRTFMADTLELREMQIKELKKYFDKVWPV